ncbi:MAG: response regulator [Candidatus Nitrosocosmicus sp.]
MNILVIDDNKYTSDAISDYCRMCNVSCKEVNDGRSGLLEIQKKDYDLIILDIAMPSYTGFDILNQLQKQRTRNKNIIILTAANLKKKDFEKYKEIGKIQVLYKPISLSQLDKAIKNSFRQVIHYNHITID